MVFDNNHFIFGKDVSFAIDNVYVKYHFIDTKKPLVVTFANADENEVRCVLSKSDVDDGISPWAFDSIKSLEVNVISFASIISPSWYRSEVFEEWINTISDYLSVFDIKVGYGDSMGAFGVSSFSNVLKLDRVLLLYPISTLNSKLVPWVNNYQFARNTYDWSKGYYDGADCNSKGYILYDPLLVSDSKHVKRYSDQLVRVRASGFGHGFIGQLQKFGVLKRIISDFIFLGYVDILGVRNKIRRYRPLSERYLDTMMKYIESNTRMEIIQHKKSMLSKLPIKNNIDVEMQYFSYLVINNNYSKILDFILESKNKSECIEILKNYGISMKKIDSQVSLIIFAMLRVIKPSGGFIRSELLAIENMQSRIK